MDYLLACLFSFIVSMAVAFLVLRLGKRLGLVDNPNERSSHSIATPRGGGAGIWLFFLVIGFLLQEPDYRFLIYTAGVIGGIGLVEDIYGISSKLRLLFQLILSAAIVAAYANISFFAHPPSLLISILFFLSCVIFISGTANFYNFMDGINGIAGLTGVVGFGLIAAFSFYFTNEKSITLLSIALASACLGFLFFNFPYAKVFMGDAGSVFLGFVFAAFVVKLSADISIFLCLIMFLCTFYADATVTVFYRWRRGENLTMAHRAHLYQYLSNELGMPHWLVSVIYASVQLLFGLSAIFAYGKGIYWQLLVLGVFSVLFLGSYIIIKNIEPKKERLYA